MTRHCRVCLGIASVFVTAALAQNPAPPKETETCTDDDYAISAAALADLFEKQEPDKILLLDHTSIGFPPGMAAMTQFGAKARALLNDVPKDAKDEFDSLNKTRARVKPDKIKGSFEVILLTDDESKKLVESGGWEPFHKKYPKAPGITLVSRPGLNAERTRALLYIGTSCDMLCGEGVFFLLGKDGGQWKVLHKETIWVS
jgi:hypothetical protein